MTSSAGGNIASSSETEASARSEQTPGAVLAAERERQGWTVQQAAEGLHLDSWIIEAIEANRFAALGAPVYAKGHLRKYATLLGLAPDEVITCYERLTDTLPVPTPIPVITTTPPTRPSWPKYLGWIVALALLVALGVGAYRVLVPMLEQRTMDAPPVMALPAGETVMPAEVVMPVSEPESPAESASSATDAEADTPASTAEETGSTAAEPEASALTPPASASGEVVRVRLSFNDASWAEAYDASGRRLLYDIGQPGRSRTVEGVPPLTVVLGVAAAVQVEVNDRTIVVPRRANRDATRFVVQADGSVQ